MHFIQNGDKVWLFTERGELMITRLSPQGVEVISRAQLIKPMVSQLPRRGGVCWAHPAFANRHVYARNDEELVCADLTAKCASGTECVNAAAWRGGKDDASRISQTRCSEELQEHCEMLGRFESP
ncbi:MAG: hypothetical protein NTW86_18290 [Candidatus Sumerlaeota bacterium]|nr:hypothetical protein [Candidatus Sumerlaeota bacterium]